MTRRFLTPLSTDHVDFNITHPSTSSQARVLWDDGEGSLVVGLKGGNVDLDIGQENVALVYNGSASAVNVGEVVYISGAQGNRPSISLADASSEAQSSKVLGVVSEQINSGSEGYVTTFGVIKNVDTQLLTPGDALWLSASAGLYTTTKPTSPDHLVFIGYCITSDSNNGRIFVNPQNGYELEEIHDVLISSPQDKDVLTYDSSTSLWKNQQPDVNFVPQLLMGGM